jgi:hypothetical protein
MDAAHIIALSCFFCKVGGTLAPFDSGVYALYTLHRRVHAAARKYDEGKMAGLVAGSVEIGSELPGCSFAGLDA